MIGKITKPLSINRLGWLICLLLIISSLALGIHSILTFNRAVIIIEWSTASELDLVGFNILRGDSEAGPFTMINQQIIPPSEDAFLGGQYSFEDTGVQAGRTYYYLLEDVEYTGMKNQHGPVTQKAAGFARTNLLLAGILGITAGFCTRNQIQKQRDHSPAAEIKSDAQP